MNKAKTAYQVSSVNHGPHGGRRLSVVGEAYAAKGAIKVVLRREPRSNLLMLVPDNSQKRRRQR